MSETQSAIAWEVSEGVGTLSFNRPEHFNGMTNGMIREFYELLRDVERDPSVAVIILTGRGKAFCPGADLKHYSSGRKDEPLRAENFLVPVLLHEMPQVTIAAINGACAGAGFGYALACDLRYAARGAKMNTAFLDVAVAGDMGVPWMLPRIVGAGRARELSFLPGKLEADEAAAIGLVNAVYEPEALMDEVRQRAARIAAAAPLARRGMKQHYVEAESLSYREFIAIETERHMRISTSVDTQEAFLAFVEKRTANYIGR
jgi:2-(1,2-epoxy-1,2-dihydrophenyl)acetyl-CoA isomerase